ncbi:unnamed protein product [Allacma fusca]|uniref:Uncharacterized protein n=1 Tax=Allacma fusca TaxID=39272 RepID=A0A8J2KXS6_9HEXA|nr:unnamed protein product [Allacma fusca]
MGAFSLSFLVILSLAWTIQEIQGTRLTFYWVVYEKDYPQGSDEQLATCSGKTLARTSKKFAEDIKVEGSGILRNEDILNLGSCISTANPCEKKNGKYNCFDKVSAPLGSQNNKLVPFVSVASNGLPFGTTGVIAEFVGKKLPNGKETHDGCVRVDDTCSTCTHNDWVDFYVLKKRNYEFILSNWGVKDNVKFTEKKCTPKKYNVK